MWKKCLNFIKQRHHQIHSSSHIKSIKKITVALDVVRKTSFTGFGLD